MGIGPCTVNVMETVAAEKSPTAACRAVITVEPKARGVTVFLSIEATAELEEE